MTQQVQPGPAAQPPVTTTACQPATGRQTLPCDVHELRSLFLFEKLDRGAAREAVPGRAGRAVRGGAGVRRGRRGHLLLRAHRGHPGAVSAGRRRRRRDQPQLRAGRVHRRLAGLPGRPGPARSTTTRCGSREPSRFFVLDADTFASMMRDWFPMAVHMLEGLFFGITERPAAGRPAGTAAGAGLTVGRADPRAEQPGRRRGPGHLHAARPGRRHAAQAAPSSPAASSTPPPWRPWSGSRRRPSNGWPRLRR